MSVIITGGSEKLGRLVAESLMERVVPSELVLVTRHPEALGELGARGARYGDFDDPASLPKTFAGGRHMLLINTDAIGCRVAQHGRAIDAAGAAGVGHVVYTSHANPVAGNPIGPVAEEHGETEGMLGDSGLAWTVLRFGSFAELQVQAARLAVARQARHQRGRRAHRARLAPRLRRCGRNRSHDRRPRCQDLRVTGPQALSQSDLAAVFAEVSGPSVKVVRVGDTVLVWGLVRYGSPKAVARAFGASGRAIREGYFGVIDPGFGSLSGRPPLSLREVLIAHRGDLVDAA